VSSILHNLTQRKSSGNARCFVKGLTGAKSLVAAHVPLLFILCVSGCSASSASDSCSDEGSGSGITISDVVADNGARYAPKGSPGEGSGLGIGSGGTTRKEERNGGGETGQQFDFHGVFVFGSGALWHLNQLHSGRQSKQSSGGSAF